MFYKSIRSKINNATQKQILIKFPYLYKWAPVPSELAVLPDLFFEPKR